MTICTFCQKECQDSHNYCSWACQVEEAKKTGAVAHTPNGLPIRCIKHDGSMLEHEHGDHPDYKYPVLVNYIGPVDGDIRHDFHMISGRSPKSDEEARSYFDETHALIYTDGSIAVTMHECCYAMWRVRTGEYAGGSLWKKGYHRLDTKSLRLPVKEPEEGSNEEQ